MTTRAAAEPIIARTMPARDACRYAGCPTMATFYVWVKKGILPGPIPGTHSYSRDALDAALDRLSGVKRAVAVSDPYSEWKQRAGKTQRR